MIKNKRLFIKKYILSKLKNNKILLLLLILFLSFNFITMARLVYKEIKKNFFLTQNFYFNSDKLRESQFLYKINNYNGVDAYPIIINMNSIKNNKLKATSDIEYDISYSCSSNANCSISKNTGTIYKENNEDYFTALITPKVSLKEKEYMVIEIRTKSKKPYVKELSAKFMLIVGNFGLSYEIKDNYLSPYLELKITNTLDYYVVREAFNNYNIGDKIDINSYMNLSPANKAKCISSIVHLDFNPNYILFDNTNKNEYLQNINTVVIDGNNYINKVKFNLEPISSTSIKFYKKNKDNDYTYPIFNTTSIVNVNFE